MDHQPPQQPRYFPAGSLPLKADVPEHQHESEQITLVLEGILLYHFGDRQVSVSAGEVIAIPQNVPHAVTGGPGGAKAVDAWSPVRPEYRAPDG